MFKFLALKCGIRACDSHSVVRHFFNLKLCYVLIIAVFLAQQMLVQLWPYINDMVIKILKENVEPEIQKNVPGFLSSIHFSEISLGLVVSLNMLFHAL